MALGKTQIIAILVAVVVVGAAAAIIIANNNGNKGGEGGDTVTITQNDGTTVEVAVPVKKLCIVNTNAGEFATILGISDRVVGVSTTMKETPTEAWWADRAAIGTYGEPDASKILETGAKVVVGQCTSMPIKNVESLKEQGITVILLDMYGYETQCSDLEQFAKLFPDTKAKDVAAKYTTFFNGIVDTIKDKVKTLADADKKVFISTMGTKADSKYYTSKAELSELLVNVCGMKNSVADLVKNPSSSTSAVAEDSIVAYYKGENTTIDLFILRNSSAYSKAASDIASFLNTHTQIKESGMFDEIKVIKTVDSKVLSGPRCFVGMVYFVNLMYPSLNVGLTVDGVISDYNTQFGTSWPSSELFYEYKSA